MHGEEVDFREVSCEDGTRTQLAHAHVGPCGQSDNGLWLMILIKRPCQDFRTNTDDHDVHSCHFIAVLKHRSEFGALR